MSKTLSSIVAATIYEIDEKGTKGVKVYTDLTKCYVCFWN